MCLCNLSSTEEGRTIRISRSSLLHSKLEASLLYIRSDGFFFIDCLFSFFKNAISSPTRLFKLNVTDHKWFFLSPKEETLNN